MSKLGQLLKTEREKLGLSLHEIGLSLKISPKVLSAIEEGAEAHLPAKTFLRGFIRSYAKYLKIDTNQALQLFQEEYGSTRPPLPIESASGTEAARTAPPATKTSAMVGLSHLPAKGEKTFGDSAEELLGWSINGRVATVIGSIFLIVLIGFVSHLVEKYKREQIIPPNSSSPALTGVPGPEPITGPSDDSLENTPPPVVSAPAPTPAPPLSGPKLQEASSHPAPEVKLNPEAKHPEASNTQPAPASPVSAVPAKNQSTTATTGAANTPTNAASPAPAGAGASGAKATEVVIEALNPVEIKYSLGGDKVETLKLDAGQVHIFKSRTKMSLDINDGGALNVVVNGRDRGVPGTIGKPIKLSYP